MGVMLDVVIPSFAGSDGISMRSPFLISNAMGTTADASSLMCPSGWRCASNSRPRV